MTTRGHGCTFASEFQRFESNFEECMSLSAIEKRFEAHTQSGVQMARDITGALSKLCNRIEGYRSRMSTIVVAERREQEQLSKR